MKKKLMKLKFISLKKNNYLFSLFIFSIMLATQPSCQRKSEDSQATSISISIPATNSSLVANASELEHVVINVSGPGMDTMTQSWSKKSNAFAGSNTLPSFSFDVPQGTDRLIQALGVYKNTTTGSMDFYYGEVIQSLSTADASVNIPIAQVGTSSGIEGQISGRYIAADNSTPTGIVNVNFTPPGRTPMIVMQQPIVAGWFNSFTLDGQKFNYTVDGVSIFDGEKQLSDFSTMGAKVLVMKFPDYYYTKSAGAPIPELSHAHAEIRGFFGAGSSNTTNKVCYSTTNVALAGYISKSWYLANPSYPYVAANPSYVSYAPSDTFSATGSSVTMTGGNAGNSPCAAGSINSWATNTLKLDPSYPSNPSYPSYPYFNSRLKGANADFTATVVVSNPSYPTQYGYNLSWSYLPDITSTDYENIIYAMTQDAFSYLAYDGHDSINCEKVAGYLDGNGEIYADGSLKVKRLATTSSTLQSITYNQISAFTDPILVLCPKKTGAETYLPGSEIRK